MSKKYKILMTTMGLNIGGAETHIVELSKELKNAVMIFLLLPTAGFMLMNLQRLE